MHKQWAGCAAENFQKNRPQAMKPEAVVIHLQTNSLPQLATLFKDPTASTSAHYAVGADGSVFQFVEETDTAFHAGIVISPSWPLLKSGINPNFYTIGIEHEGSPNNTLPGAQYDATADLIGEILDRWNIPADEQHIVLHQEIRSSKQCPGPAFNRDELFTRLRARAQTNTIVQANASPAAVASAAAGLVTQSADVKLLKQANLRDGAPSSSSRIDRVIPANSVVQTTGFTDQGERISGNSSWYQTSDNNYFWAGAADQPNPVKQGTQVTPVQPSATGAKSGIERIDMLLQFGGKAIDSSDDKDSIGVVQDLLTGLGVTGLPSLLSPQYGTFGQATTRAIQFFRLSQNLGAGSTVDQPTLQELISQPAVSPRATRAYLTLVLGFPWGGLAKILALISTMEGAGKFAALNLNTDRAGLSYGLIQWAQKVGRLAEILKAMRDADSEEFARIFAQGDANLATDLLLEVNRTSGGVDPATGIASHPAFNLVAEPWVSRFRQSALTPVFQEVQVQQAITGLQRAVRFVSSYAPQLQSERAIAFMVDVANQFGDNGARHLFQLSFRTGMTETEALQAIAELSVSRMPENFQTSVRMRRDTYLQSPILSDQQFGA